jgi:hypothetical protein
MLLFLGVVRRPPEHIVCLQLTNRLGLESDDSGLPTNCLRCLEKSCPDEGQDEEENGDGDVLFHNPT